MDIVISQQSSSATYASVSSIPTNPPSLKSRGETVVKQAVNRLWPRDLTPTIALARPQP